MKSLKFFTLQNLEARFVFKSNTAELVDVFLFRRYSVALNELIEVKQLSSTYPRLTCEKIIGVTPITTSEVQSRVATC